MKVIQTFQQGGRHKTNNQPCEDRTYHLSKNNVEAIALADGAGSSKYTHSAEGAECVTKAISEFFCNNFDKFYEKQDPEELCAVIMTVCQRALQKKAEELNLDAISRLSSTLLCVAIKNDDVICCHIGDGTIGKLTPEGTKVVSSPDNGEFASTTFFITNPNADKHLHITKEKLDDTLAYFLMSDGTADYIYNKADNSFYDAAKKMALMALDENGQTTLFKTVKTYMVEKDSKSDDCSFISLTLESAKELVPVASAVSDAPAPILNTIPENPNNGETSFTYPAQQNIEDILAKFESPAVPTAQAQIQASQSKASRSKKKNMKLKLMIIAASVFVLIVALVLVLVLHNNNDKKDSESTSGKNSAAFQTIVDSTDKEKESQTTVADTTDKDNTTTAPQTTAPTTAPQTTAPTTAPQTTAPTTAPGTTEATTAPQTTEATTAQIDNTTTSESAPENT